MTVTVTMAATATAAMTAITTVTTVTTVTLWMDGIGLGWYWLSLVVGSLRAPVVLINAIL